MPGFSFVDAGAIQNRHETREAFLYKPAPRSRSEASFSEFHYDNSEHAPAGVRSAQLWRHKAKDCSDRDHRSQIKEIIRMTEEQQRNSQSEKLDGPRLDPAKAKGYAGNMSENTKVKVTLLGNHGTQTAPGPTGSQTQKVKRERNYILDIARKSPAACAPPPRSTDPLRPPEEKYNRRLKRNGYKLQESRWTWNESHEVTGQDKEFLEAHSPEKVLEGLSPVRRRLYTSVKGEKKYNICGAQDMLPPATKLFSTADNPPSTRHIYENDKKHLQGFERGCRPKGRSLEAQVEYMGESPEMWNCMAGQERPLEKWRSMSARTGQHNWMSSAESVYANNENTRSMASRNATSQSERSLKSPGSPQYYDTYDGDRTRRLDMRRSSEAGSRVSRTSRASATSSQRQLEQQRWR